MPRHSVILDDETAAWLISQPGGRSGTIRWLARQEMARNQGDDRGAFRAALKAELLEEIREELAVGMKVHGVPVVPQRLVNERVLGQGGDPADSHRIMETTAAKTVSRWM